MGSDSKLNVVVAGASGNLGGPVLKALVNAGTFNVTVLTRSESNQQFPSSVKVEKVDYGSLESLTKALTGATVLISTISKSALPTQLRLVDAAVLADVKRIIPSEFGGNLKHEKTRKFPSYKDKVAIEEYIEEKAVQSGITYTYIFNNMFLDWALRGGMMLNFKTHEANLYDGGDVPFSTTRIPTVAKGIVGVLLNLEATRNRAVYIHDIVTTPNALLRLAQAKSPGIQWTTRVVDTAKLEADARAEMVAGTFSPKVFYAFAARGGFAEGYGGHFEKVDNQLLGIESMSAQDLEDLIGTLVKEGLKASHIINH